METTTNRAKPPDNSNNPDINEIQQDFILNALNRETSLNKKYEKQYVLIYTPFL